MEDINIDPVVQEKYLSRDFSKEFSLFIERFKALSDFNIETIEATFREMVKDLNIEAKVLIHPIRVVLTGKTIGPGLFEVMYYLGKEKTEKRLSRWIKRNQG